MVTSVVYYNLKAVALRLGLGVCCLKILDLRLLELENLTCGCLAAVLPCCCFELRLVNCAFNCFSDLLWCTSLNDPSSDFLEILGVSHFSDLIDLVGAIPPWLPWLWAKEGRHGGTTPTKLFLKWDAPEIFPLLKDRCGM